MIRRKPFAEARLQRFARKLLHGFRCSQNWPAQWMLRPEATGKNFVQQRLRVIEIHLDLFENHLALFVYILGIEKRAQAKVGNDVKGDRQMLVEHFRVEANLFFGGKSVQHSANRVHFAGYGFSGAALGALEDHVLHKMSEAVLLGGFAAGTIANPNADRNRADMGRSEEHTSELQSRLHLVCRL